MCGDYIMITLGYMMNIIFLLCVLQILVLNFLLWNSYYFVCYFFPIADYDGRQQYPQQQLPLPFHNPTLFWRALR